jgi:hypothetical protein
MNDTITNVLIPVAIIWGIVGAITLSCDLATWITSRWRARKPRWVDPWSCPELCGQEYSWWCEHLADEARCPAMNERGEQCSRCRGHNAEALTWPGLAIDHQHDHDRSLSS